MKQSSLTIFFAAFMTALFSACSDDFGDMEIPTEELYARSFVKEFGVYDQNHTWCVATPTSITINPQSLINEVKVYSKTDGHYYYVARYTNLYKTTTITFDAPAGTTDLKLKIDGTTYYAQAGTTLTVSGGSRNVHTSSEGATITIAPSNTPLYFNVQQLGPILSNNKGTDCDGTVYAEDVKWGYYPYSKSYDNYTEDDYKHGYGGLVPEKQENITNTKITKDFYFESGNQQTTITIYPLYWNSSSTHTLGLYYYPTGSTQMVTVPIYTDKVFETKNYDADKCQLNEKVCEDSQYGIYYTASQLSGTTADLTIITTLINEYNAQCTNDDDKMKVSDLVDSSDNSKFSSNFEALVAKLNAFINNSVSYGSGLYPGISGLVLPKVQKASGEEKLQIIYYKWKNITPPNNNGNAAYDFSSPKLIRSKGIDITVPANIKFGMYITSGDNLDTDGYPTEGTTKTLYSEASENEKLGESIAGKNGTYNFAATYLHPINNRQYFSFEDWTTSSSDADLNDLIFVLNNATSITHTDGEKVFEDEDEDTPYEWLICAEDLGTTDDFDFNDMIVKVETLTNGDGGEGTYTWAKFTAMAAGGTLPLNLYFDPTKIFEGKDEDGNDLVSSINTSGLMYPDGKGESYAEFHQWFGTSGYPSSEMINTSGSNGVGGRYCTLYIDGTFSLYANATTKANEQVTESSSVKNTLASFWIEVKNSKASENEKQIIKPKFRSEEEGKEFSSYAPQMFVIPYSWHKTSDTNNTNPTYYQWPTERKNISDAYNTTGFTFKSWVEADLVSTSTWYRYPVAGTTCRPWPGEIAPD